MRSKSFPLLAVLALGGCGVGTIVDIATAPVRVVGKAVDMATTSHSEADEKRGRELRKREERYGKLEREWRKQASRCDAGKAEACTRRDEIGAEMDQLRSFLPAETD